MTVSAVSPVGAPERKSSRDIGFAIGIVAILSIFFLPIPPFLIDLGLSFSIALSVLILMVGALDRPAARLLRLSDRAARRHDAAPRAEYRDDPPDPRQRRRRADGGRLYHRRLLPPRDERRLRHRAHRLRHHHHDQFRRHHEGARPASQRSALGSPSTPSPGKQMAIDADLSAGLINDKEAQRRRRELEEESAFFGSMDGASKFVRGDAIAGLIVLAVNIFGGIIIGVTRHGLALGQAADVFAKLSVGDGLVSQVPALIVSLGAALLVSKGGTRGSANKAVLDQLVRYPRALMVASILMFMLGILPGLPFLPFGSARRGDALRRLFDAEEAGGPPAGRERPGCRSRTPSCRRGQGFGQGIPAHLRGRALPRQAVGRPADLRQQRAQPPGRQDAAQVRAPIRVRRARDQGLGQPGAAVEDLPDQDPRNRRGHPGAAARRGHGHHGRWCEARCARHRSGASRPSA